MQQPITGRGICEGIREGQCRPTMRFVEVKSAAQVDVQALHRIRDQMVRSRTRLICQMRSFCLENGVAIREEAGVFKLDLPRVIADDSNDLTPTMRRLLTVLPAGLHLPCVYVCRTSHHCAGCSRQCEQACWRELLQACFCACALMHAPTIGRRRTSASTSAASE